MHIDIVPNRNSKPAVLLRESYRDGKTVRKRTLANLSALPMDQVDAIRRILKGEKLRVRYTSAKSALHDVTIHPYTLVAYKRGLYVIAAVEEWEGKVVSLALERVQRADWLKGEAFDYPEKYDPDEFFASALFLDTGTPELIEVVFNESTRPFVEHRKYHRTQKLELLEDGRTKLTMRVPLGDEVKYWVLSFGANAEVIGPPALREAVAEELRKAAGSYSSAAQLA